MIVVSELLLKYIPSMLAALATVVTLWKGWVYSSDRIYEQREKSSKFIYELYKISGEEYLKKLSIEYGYAAITRDNKLSFEQRNALLTSKNPTSDIDAYRKCSHLLTISCNPLRFEWISKRHKFLYYRKLVMVIMTLVYIVGAYAFTLPLTYNVMVPASVLNKVNVFTPLNKGLLTLYLIFVGGCLALWSLNKVSKIRIAENLRKNHIS